MYGWPRELPIDETRPYRPVGPYGQSKVHAEQLVRASGVPFTIVQPSITYGPGDTNGMIDKMFRMIARGLFVRARAWHCAGATVYVEDLARIILEASASKAALGEAVICTHRDPVRVGDLVQRMASIVHRVIPPVGPPTALLRLAGSAFELGEALHLLSGEPPVTREKLATISVDSGPTRSTRCAACWGPSPRRRWRRGSGAPQRSCDWHDTRLPGAGRRPRHRVRAGAIYSLFDRWLGRRPCRAPSRAPSTGWPESPGLHLLGRAKAGVHVRVELTDAAALERVRGVYRHLGLSDRLETAVEAPGEPGKTKAELVLTYNALPLVDDWRGYLGRVARRSTRYLLVSVTSPFSYGVMIRKAMHPWSAAATGSSSISVDAAKRSSNRC